MIKKALGLVETIGLIPAIEAVDAGLKTADVKLLGVENSRGGGRIVVKFEGAVSAVTEAVDAAAEKASALGGVYAVKVIASPSDGLYEEMHKPGPMNSISYGGFTNYSIRKKETARVREEAVTETETEAGIRDAKAGIAVCNLCKDPNCPRKPGEKRSLCIHHEEGYKPEKI